MRPGLNMRLSMCTSFVVPRHDVADALPAVEGLALAQQAGVQLVAGVALDAGGDELDRVVAQQAR